MNVPASEVSAQGKYPAWTPSNETKEELGDEEKLKTIPWTGGVIETREPIKPRAPSSLSLELDESSQCVSWSAPPPLVSFFIFYSRIGD